MVSGGFITRRQYHQRDASCSSVTLLFKIGGFFFFAVWFATMMYHIWPNNSPLNQQSYENSNKQLRRSEIIPLKSETSNALPFEETDDSYHIVFSTGCSEFQDWQSIGVYSSAKAVGQRGIITRIASGCTKEQEAALTHAMSHLPMPTKWRIHFAPNTDVKDHNGHFYKYANKPLGMMHWLMHAEPKIPPDATVALIDPDFYFLMPLWHDSFDSPDKYFATGAAVSIPMPTDARNNNKARIIKGSMIAQRYGIGGKPWTLAPGRNNQKAWDLRQYFTSIGRANSPALAADLIGHEDNAATYFSIGAPYIALASDWLPISTNWTALMYMAVERNFGNLAEMYAMVIAVADYGIRPVMIDSLMVSNVQVGDEAWPFVDKLPMDKGCDPSILLDRKQFPLPTFLHYCQTYTHPDIKPPQKWASFSKYAVPDEILACPEGGDGASKQKSGKSVVLGSDGLLPEPNIHSVAHNIKELRNIFSYCFATRGTNQAARDYRAWYCEQH